MKDTPSLVDENAANFATLNPLDGTLNYDPVDGNLKVTLGGVVPRNKLGTMAVSSGKFYWEMFIESATTAQRMGIGVVNVNTKNNYFSTNTDSVGYSAANGNTLIDGSSATYGATFTTGDTIGVAFNLDDNELTFYKNGVSQGVITSKTFTGSYLPFFAHGSSSGTETIVVNFGQRPFKYTPPTGFLKLNTFNLPDSTIEDGSDYFTPVLYTGNGSTGHQITAVGFQPDFVWAKGRSVGYSHGLFDAVRGANNKLTSNLTNAEVTQGLTAFDSDGFTLDSDAGLNQSAQTYVAWNWKANGSGVSNNVGSIPSTVSANTEAGFSIVTYTGNAVNGATIGHGLSAAPAMWLLKKRVNNSGTSTGNWIVMHKGNASVSSYSNSTTISLTSYTNALLLNSTSAQLSYGFDAQINGNTDTFIAYVFSEVPGYSAFGSYTGNGSADGPFVYTGFRPAFVIIKETTSTGSWVMLDTTRSTYNVINNDSLWANLNSAEGGSASYFDMLSNGFKIRDTDSDKNSSGQTYIYMAFAENPFKNANAR